MSRGEIYAALRAALRDAAVRVRARRTSALAPVHELGVSAGGWARAAGTAKAQGWRLASLWAEERGRSLLLTAIVENLGVYGALRTRARMSAPSLPSIALVYPLADRLERHARDLFGIEFDGHPDPRRWTRHQAWGAQEHPLRASFPAARHAVEGMTAPDAGYPFRAAQGAGVYEIPVGPVHAGIIEPGHFRFQAVGEEVLGLEERLGYVHKGIEKIAAGRDPAALARLAARISGDSPVAHGWAACMAVERAAGTEPPSRALRLRAVLAEVERVTNHLWDIAAVCNDVAFAFVYYQFGRVVEDWRRVNAEVFGHRLLMDTVVPGGVARDLSPGAAERIVAQCESTRRELTEIWGIAQENASLHDRLAAAGVLAPEDAKALGCVGYVGRASGQDFDVRRDAPYAPYDTVEILAPSFEHGDVAARVRVRHDEILVSLELIRRLLETLPDGAVRIDIQTPSAGAEGIGIVDGWRGEVVTYVRFAANGRVGRFFPRDPSWTTWPALERLIHGNIVPDFPVCNKSINGSYSGHDL
ncbi:MAG: NADH-quinone oxidoreductase subunit C [Pseudomonadota bacterium]|nr:NADH-quinone oxidoreductase subunit C [Pseudomonadota bacterium]